MHAFDAYKLFMQHSSKPVLDWILENINPVTYTSPPHNGERHSHYHETSGDGWRYKHIITLNKIDQYPDNFARVEAMALGVSSEFVYHYAVFEIDSDADAILFKLKWL